jgi:actin-related protein 5
MLRNFCEFAPDYPSLLKSLKDPLNLRASEQIIQFPYVLPVQEEKTEEELARIAEKRKEQGKKLQEMAAKNRQEKVCICTQVLIFVRHLIHSSVQLVQKENDLQYLLNLRDERGTESKREWAVRFIHSSLHRSMAN